MKKHVNTEACLKKEKRHKDMTTVFKTIPSLRLLAQTS